MSEIFIPKADVYIPFPLREKRHDVVACRIWNEAYDRSYAAALAANEAAGRMRAKFSGDMGTSLDKLYDFFTGHEEFITPATWLTDHREAAFPHRFGYHVTSDLALKTLAEGGKLHPPFLHALKSIMSHRGVALHVVDKLLQYFTGSELSNKRNYLWLSTFIDMEQVALEEHISQLQVDDQLLSLLCEGMGMHPLLAALLKHVHDGTPVLDNALIEYRDKLLSSLTRLGGIRGAWYRTISMILTGEKAHHRNDTEDDFLHKLTVHEHLLGKSSSGATAVVLEVDLHRAFEDMNRLALLDLNGRDPAQIQNLPRIEHDWITRVYTEDPDKLPFAMSDIQYPVLPLADVPTELFLGGVRSRNIDEIDPSHPLCDTRYGTRDVGKYWRQQLMSGHIAPVLGSANWREGQVSMLFGDNLYTENPKEPAWGKYREIILYELQRRHRFQGVW